MKNILIIEDDEAIQEMLTHFLKREGFGVYSAYNVREGRDLLLSQSIQMILLDWMLPEKSGLLFLKELKADRHNRAIPVIMLSARAELDDRLTGLDSGADDYLPKPFSPKELLSRINSLFRRIESYHLASDDEGIVRFEGLTLDIKVQRLTIDGEPINLSAIEFRLLAFFMTHLNWVYSRTQLLDYVWGLDNYVDERTVDVTIGRLRKVLEPTGHHRLLQTVRGEGYRFSQVL